MSTHYLVLAEPFHGAKIGNSAKASWDGNRLLVIHWKGLARGFDVRHGDRVQVRCNGEFPEVMVMKPPSDPVARVAWEHGFFKSKRYDSLDELQEKAKGVKWYHRMLGYSVPCVHVYLSAKGNCALAYKASGDKDSEIPWGWWAGHRATIREMKRLFEEIAKECASGKITA